jgi:hypothetical protein
MEPSHDVDENQYLKQRIYVGGIDPNRGLTVAEVWQRLEAKLSHSAHPPLAPPNSSHGAAVRPLTTTMSWYDVHQGRCYLQFTAMMASKNNDANPLGIIKSWFHNVTWKGCKLIVQEARPHLLQRLQDERNARLLHHSTTELPVVVARVDPPTETDVTETDPQCPISRYWKIKRGYFGEPVRHVDTQPCEVTSWSMLSRLRQRHVTYQEKEKMRHIQSCKGGGGMTLKEAQKYAYYNRSIRFRFTDDGNVVDGSTNCTALIEQSMGDVEETDDSSASTNKSLLGSSENKSYNKLGNYVWSDDDDDEEQYENELSVNVKNKATTEDQEALQNKHTTTTKYAWSDDDDSSNSSATRHDKGTGTSQSRPRDLDEFESAMDTVDDDNILDDVTHASIDMNTTLDLTNDVETNLNILSQLFPEISKAQPALTDVDAAETYPAKHVSSTSTGWGSNGQMLRFDPNRPQSASLLVVDDVPSECNNDQERENVAIESDLMTIRNETDQPHHDESTTAESLEVVDGTTIMEITNIYEQKKLEQVFKEVREGVPIASSSGIVGDASFSFGFDVGNTDCLKDQQSSTFSFSFQVPGGEVASVSLPEPMNTDNQDNGNDREMIQDSDSLNADQLPQNDDRPRYRAFEFPDEEMLNKSVQDYYFKHNDGERIIKDPEGWRNDPIVKEKWIKERFTLTQDWKRKRKYALSKKQKRLRQYH